MFRLVARSGNGARHGSISNHIPSRQPGSRSLTSWRTVVATRTTWKSKWYLSLATPAMNPYGSAPRCRLLSRVAATPEQTAEQLGKPRLTSITGRFCVSAYLRLCYTCLKVIGAFSIPTTITRRIASNRIMVACSHVVSMGAGLCHLDRRTL